MVLFNFNTSYVTVQQQFPLDKKDKRSKFQYILCYGSTFLGLLRARVPVQNFNTSYVTVQLNDYYFYLSSLRNFNTSYVTVQHYWNEIHGEKKFISIHPMLRFNRGVSPVLILSPRISIHPMLRFNSKLWIVLRKPLPISIHPMLRFNLL